MSCHGKILYHTAARQKHFKTQKAGNRWRTQQSPHYGGIKQAQKQEKTQHETALL
ncbi:hypothetical protein [Testudinibacter sp. TR-2022]|uniref:hypothetical protein n=1 Tax=Testudinibacter sp. TR-2022 TaxID=2585029 RepID=UPI00159B887E|nr:hypothetical protein [Testudinibacter sp. TR-2022]